MAQGITVIGQSDAERDLMGANLALDLALQDALSDLVQAKGIDYLDTFLERRLRRTISTLRTAAPAAAPELVKAELQRQADAAEKAIRGVIEAVRQDPTPVI